MSSANAPAGGSGGGRGEKSKWNFPMPAENLPEARRGWRSSLTALRSKRGKPAGMHVDLLAVELSRALILLSNKESTHSRFSSVLDREIDSTATDLASDTAVPVCFGHTNLLAREQASLLDGTAGQPASLAAACAAAAAGSKGRAALAAVATVTAAADAAASRAPELSSSLQFPALDVALTMDGRPVPWPLSRARPFIESGEGAGTDVASAVDVPFGADRAAPCPSPSSLGVASGSFDRPPVASSLSASSLSYAKEQAADTAYQLVNATLQAVTSAVSAAASDAARRVARQARHGGARSQPDRGRAGPLIAFEDGEDDGDMLAGGQLLAAADGVDDESADCAPVVGRHVDRAVIMVYNLNGGQLLAVFEVFAATATAAADAPPLPPANRYPWLSALFSPALLRPHLDLLVQCVRSAGFEMAMPRDHAVTEVMLFDSGVAAPSLPQSAPRSPETYQKLRAPRRSAAQRRAIASAAGRSRSKPEGAGTAEAGAPAQPFDSSSPALWRSTDAVPNHDDSDDHSDVSGGAALCVPSDESPVPPEMRRRPRASPANPLFPSVHTHSLQLTSGVAAGALPDLVLNSRWWLRGKRVPSEAMRPLHLLELVDRLGRQPRCAGRALVRSGSSGPVIELLEVEQTVALPPGGAQHTASVLLSKLESWLLATHGQPLLVSARVNRFVAGRLRRTKPPDWVLGLLHAAMYTPEPGAASTDELRGRQPKRSCRRGNLVSATGTHVNQVQKLLTTASLWFFDGTVAEPAFVAAPASMTGSQPKRARAESGLVPAIPLSSSNAPS